MLRKESEQSEVSFQQMQQNEQATAPLLANAYKAEPPSPRTAKVIQDLQAQPHEDKYEEAKDIDVDLEDRKSNIQGESEPSETERNSEAANVTKKPEKMKYKKIK